MRFDGGHPGTSGRVTHGPGTTTDGAAGDGSGRGEEEPRRGRNYERSHETQAERLDRNWNELLQELRVAQTGVQILFAFLLTIAFTRPFQESGDLTHVVFAVTLVLAALATSLLVGPVAMHRMVFRKGLKDELVAVAQYMATAGLFLLMLTLGGGLFVALDVVMERGLAVMTISALAVWFLCLWYVLPAVVVRRAARGDD